MGELVAPYTTEEAYCASVCFHRISPLKLRQAVTPPKWAKTSCPSVAGVGEAALARSSPILPSGPRDTTVFQRTRPVLASTDITLKAIGAFDGSAILARTKTTI